MQQKYDAAEVYIGYNGISKVWLMYLEVKFQ